MISVIIPVYNSGDYLRGCIKSVLYQTFTDIEVIVVDDGSTDSSPEICDYFSAEDSRVKVIRQQNRGPLAARAAGVALAAGEWLCFVDSDDRLYRFSLEYLYGLSGDDVDIVVTGGTRNCIMNLQEYVAGLLDFRYWPVWGKLYRRQLWNSRITSLPSYFSIAEDFLANMRIALNISRKIVLSTHSVYDYNRLNTASLQHKTKVDQKYDEMVIGEVTDTIIHLRRQGKCDNRVNHGFIKWRLNYMAGMIGLGYQITKDDLWVSQLLNEISDYSLTIRQKMAIHALSSQSLRYLFRMEKMGKGFIRSLLQRSLVKYHSITDSKSASNR